MTKNNQYFPQSRPYPGLTLLEKMEEMGMNTKDVAQLTGIPEKTINAVINGIYAITADLAVQLENITRIPAHFWLNSQKNYDNFIKTKNYSLSQKKIFVDNWETV